MARKIKTVIFDLDDTLFDTFSQLVGPASREACEAMVQCGLAASVDDCLTKRKEFQRENLRFNVYSKIVGFFGTHNQLDNEVVAQAGRVAFHRRRIKEDIKLFPDTLNVLERIKTNYKIFLVTLGDPETQMAKVKLLGLENVFERIYYVNIQTGETKKSAYLEILNKTGVEPFEIVSIGNRIDTDVGFAKELGFLGVLFEHGEYLHLKPEATTEIPDIKVKTLGEFETWLKNQ